MNRQFVWKLTGRLSPKVNPNGSSTSTMAVGFERVLACGTGFGSVIVGDVLERGRASGTFGASMAGVSLVGVVGSSVASSLVAVLSELRGSSAEEDMVTG